MEHKAIVDNFISQVPPEMFNKEDELVLYLRKQKYESIKSEVVNGFYKNVKVKLENATPNGMMFVTPLSNLK